MILLDIFTLFNLGLYIFLIILSLKYFKKSIANKYFFLLIFSSFLWILVVIVQSKIPSGQIDYFFTKFDFAVAALVALFLVLFALYFRHDAQNVKLKRDLMLTIPIVVLIILSISNQVVYLSDKNEIIYHSFWYPIYITILILYFIFIGGIVLVRQYFISFGIIRLQLQYFLLGYSIAIVILLLTSIYNAIFSRLPEAILQTIVNISVFFSALSAYSILRYRLMDIRVVIRKGFVHFLSLLIILFLYIYLLIFSQKFFVDQYGWSEQTSTIVLVLVIVLTLEPLRRFLFKVVDKVFYSKQKDVRAEARKLRVTLTSAMQFDQLIKKVKKELRDFLEVEGVQFIWINKQTGRLENYYKDDKKVSFGPTDPFLQYLQNNPNVLVTEEIPYLIEEQGNGSRELLKNVEKKLKGLNIGLVLPIGETGELVGAFFFGQKKNKEAFTSDNVEYLQNMKFPMTNAIANALLYKQAVERITKI